MPELSLYNWQQEALQAFYTHHRHGIIQAVTGSGKTRLAVAIMLRLFRENPGLHIRIVVPTLLLASQWGKAIREQEEVLGRPGYFHSGSKSREPRKVTIYVINTARYSISRHILEDMRSGHPVFLICDECHHCASPENKKIFAFLTQRDFRNELYMSLGLSATPEDRSEDQILQHALGDLIYSYHFTAAKEEHTVSDFVIGKVAVGFTGEELSEYAEITEKLGILYKKLLWLYPFLQDMPAEAIHHAIKKLAEEAGDDPEDPAAAYRLLFLRRKLLTIMAENRESCALHLTDSGAREPCARSFRATLSEF